MNVLEIIKRQTPFGTVVLIIWQTLPHAILHGMEHHTELARLPSEASQSPGDIDFLLCEALAYHKANTYNYAVCV